MSSESEYEPDESEEYESEDISEFEDLEDSSDSSLISPRRGRESRDWDFVPNYYPRRLGVRNSPPMPRIRLYFPEMFSLEEIHKALSYPDRILPLPSQLLTPSIVNFAVLDSSPPKSSDSSEDLIEQQIYKLLVENEAILQLIGDNLSRQTQNQNPQSSTSFYLMTVRNFDLVARFKANLTSILQRLEKLPGVNLMPPFGVGRRYPPPLLSIDNSQSDQSENSSQLFSSFLASYAPFSSFV